MKLTAFFGIFIFMSATAVCQQPVPGRDSTLPGKVPPAAAKAKGVVRPYIKKLREDKSDSVRITRSKQVTDRMSDNLGLSQTQRADLLNINAGLELQKSLLYKTDTSRANIGRELQRIEKQRDVLYRSVLTEKQFQLYEKSKINLINPQPRKRIGA
jgi:hypothetical protein